MRTWQSLSMYGNASGLKKSLRLQQWLLWEMHTACIRDNYHYGDCSTLPVACPAPLEPVGWSCMMVIPPCFEEVRPAACHWHAYILVQANGCDAINVCRVELCVCKLGLENCAELEHC